MGEKVNPQVQKPKTASRKRRAAIATLGLLAVALGAWAIYGYATRKPEITLDLGNNVKMRLVLIPAGTFMMGSPANEANRDSNETQHEVTLSKSFYMGIYEVTQEQYEAVMGTNHSQFKGATNPVEQVSWDDAAEFCKKLSAKTGKRVMLPTEAQWEYACRAGTTTSFNTGQTLSPNQANTDSSTPTPGAWEKFMEWIGKLIHRKPKGTGTTPVGSFKPNAFGLYDTHGNICEWCDDWYGEDYYAISPKTDPQGPETGPLRVLRGGSWFSHPFGCRSAIRDRIDPDYRSYDIGFRVVMDLK